MPRVVAVLLALTVHELAHGWVALQLGDPTAKTAGRITLNPLAHLDPIGTILLFLVGFGWAKPVPVNPNNFRNPVRDNALVGLAGPVSNFATAIVFGIALRILLATQGIANEGPMWGVMVVLFLVTVFSIGLGLFNLIPIPPLDGSHVLEAILPRDARQTLHAIRPYAPFVLIILVFSGLLGIIVFVPMSVLFQIITGENLFPMMRQLMG